MGPQPQTKNQRLRNYSEQEVQSSLWKNPKIDYPISGNEPLKCNLYKDGFIYIFRNIYDILYFGTAKEKDSECERKEGVHEKG